MRIDAPFVSHEDEIAEAALGFYSLSDAETRMGDLHVPYRGLKEPEEAFKFAPHMGEKVKHVNAAGEIALMDSVEFIGGVVFALAETGEITAESATPSKFAELMLEIGKIAGTRNTAWKILDKIEKLPRATPGDWGIPKRVLRREIEDVGGENG